MAQARNLHVSLDATPYYHCVSHCVRHAILCGIDPYTGIDYEHRRTWIEDRILFLPRYFAMEVCAYAVMGNHFHVVLQVETDKAIGWSMHEVISRWHELFKGTRLTQKYIQNEKLTKGETKQVIKTTEEWRNRLMDISWFIRLVKETVARKVNLEDGCTGRFWEGRFKSQGLLDEKALLSCMAYVDLNPIRSRMARTLRTSKKTSIKLRIDAAKQANSSEAIKYQPKNLAPFAGNPRKRMPRGIQMRLNDYLELVEWTGRILSKTKRGAIPKSSPSLLKRLRIDPKHWLDMTQHFESHFKRLVGSDDKLKHACQLMGFKRTVGLTGSHLFKAAPDS